jgi:hypothetical protein
VVLHHFTACCIDCIGCLKGEGLSHDLLADYDICSCLTVQITDTMVSEKRDEVERPGASATSDSDIEILEGTVNEKKLLRKLDLRLLPAVSILYLLSFLDRSNGTQRLIPFRALSNDCSGQRSNRGPHDRPWHDRKPIPDRSHALLHWLRALRSTL